MRFTATRKWPIVESSYLWLRFMVSVFCEHYNETAITHEQTKTIVRCPARCSSRRILVFRRYPLSTVLCSCAWLVVSCFPAAGVMLYNFSALSTVYMFSRALYLLHVFPRFALVTCFPRLAPVTCFPRFVPVTCFPALSTGYMFSRALYRLHVSRALHRLHVFPRFAPVTCFPSLCTSYMFSRAWHRVCVFASTSDWFIASLTYALIGQT